MAESTPNPVKYAKDIQVGDQIQWRHSGQTKTETVTKWRLNTNRRISIHFESGRYLSLHDLEIITLA